jgi:V/A-type H+-transporting ATPase subunit I
MSMAFGLLFGSVFAREDLLPALWLRPLEDPITLLLVALLFGSIVIAAGLALETLQWRWHAERGRSWRAPLALLASYCIAVTGLIFDARIAWLVLPSVAWYLFEITHGAAAGERARTLGKSLSELTETAVRLIINTLSFVRVGAFALGHAGLGIAVVSLAEAAGSRAAALLVMVLGNGLVIVLEGLVVGIQTTRLVLFEFFIRFIRSGGRPFAPLPPPGGETHSENE